MPINSRPSERKMQRPQIRVLCFVAVFLAFQAGLVGAGSFRRRVIFAGVPSAHMRSPSTRRSEESSASLSVPQRLVAGGTARAIAQMVLYPIDALRTLAQTRDGRTLADVGAGALVRGCATTSSFALLIGSVQFAIFGAARDFVGPVAASALGAAGSCIVSVPQEVIKQRLVTGIYSSFRHACRTIYREEGVRGFYSAWRPTVARNVPFVIVTFSTQDVLKQKRLKRTCVDESEKRELSVKENLAIGVSSALAAAVVTQPADVIKTRMMTQAASSAVPYSSTFDCIKTILRTEGIVSLYSGFPQRTMYMGPLWAIQFALNGHVSKLLKNQNRIMASGTS